MRSHAHERFVPRAHWSAVAHWVPLALALTPTAAAWAQGSLPLPRPGDERPELPDFEPPERRPGKVLPPLRLPEEPDLLGMAGGVRVFVRSYEVVGNTVLAPEEIQALTEPYTGRAVSFAELVELRDRLTLAYVERDYETSGAEIPEQRIDDGIVRIRIVEGLLSEIHVESDGRFRKSYFERRLRRSTAGPVNVRTLEERLQLFQKDPRIRQVVAQLTPGERRGESMLQVEVMETPPYWVQVGFDNAESPSVGAEGGHASFRFDNLGGVGDRFDVVYRGTPGLQDVTAGCEIPFTDWDTSFGTHFRRAWSEVIEQPFDALDIKSESETYGLSLRQPLYRSASTDLTLSLVGEWRRSQTFLFGDGFAFAPGPSANGVAKVAVLRFGQEWAYSGRRQAFAARSLLSFGLPILGATENSGREIPDGEYFAWLGQVQGARRFDLLDLELVGRVDLQLADSPLLSLEQLSIGGAYTVRGYRENTLVRDNGVIGSLELRVPVWRRPESAFSFELAPFVDAGKSWNTDRPNDGPETLLSVGIGGRFAFTHRVQLQVYWGHDLKRVETAGAAAGDYNLQDDGIHLALTLEWP